MEQVISIINRLEQQVLRQAPVQELLATISLLRTEVEALCPATVTQRDSVAVWLPAGYRATVAPRPVIAEVAIPEPEPELLPESPKVEVKIAAPLFVPLPPRAPAPPAIVAETRPVEVIPQVEERIYTEGPVIFQLEVSPEEIEIEAPVEVKKPEMPAPAPVTVAAPAARPFPQYADVDALMKNIFPSAPTPKSAPREVNEIAGNPITALNTRLAAATDKKVELAEVLVTGSRINDIRKAISINEKYQMINSLFRGDEDMFERSIRTLNNFGSLPEARFWMQRELILKLGWNEEDELVKHVYRLVNRRFS